MSVRVGMQVVRCNFPILYKAGSYLRINRRFHADARELIVRPDFSMLFLCTDAAVIKNIMYQKNRRRKLISVHLPHKPLISLLVEVRVVVIDRKFNDYKIRLKRQHILLHPRHAKL